MKVYFVTQKWFQSDDFIEFQEQNRTSVTIARRIHLEPRVPESMGSDESDRPRICVSNSVLGALSAVGKNLYCGVKTFVYSAEIDNGRLYQPHGNEVLDAFLTGELWLLKPVSMTLEHVLKVKKIELFDTNGVEVANVQFEIL